MDDGKRALGGAGGGGVVFGFPDPGWGVSLFDSLVWWRVWRDMRGVPGECVGDRLGVFEVEGRRVVGAGGGVLLDSGIEAGLSFIPVKLKLFLRSTRQQQA